MFESRYWSRPYKVPCPGEKDKECGEPMWVRFFNAPRTSDSPAESSVEIRTRSCACDIDEDSQQFYEYCTGYLSDTEGEREDYDI